MAFSHGKNAVVTLDNSGGTPVAITAYLSKAAMELMRDTAETTVLGLNSKTYLAGLRDGTFSCEGKFDGTLDSQLSGLLGSTSTATLQYDPQGSTSGLPRYSVECLITKYSFDTDIGDAGTLSFDLQFTGDVTRSTVP